MVTCSVKNCQNNSHNSNTNTHRRFFRFPSDQERRKIWTQFCGRESFWVPNINNRICSAHFDDTQFEQHRMDGRKKLSPAAVPNVYKEYANLCEVIITEDKHDVAMVEIKQELFDCESTELFDEYTIWLDHDYCKMWDTEVGVTNDGMFWKVEADRLAAELELKKQELHKAKGEIEALKKKLMKNNNLKSGFESEL